MDSSKVQESQADNSYLVRSKRTQGESTVNFKDPLPKRAKAVINGGHSPEINLTGISNRPLSHPSLGRLSVSNLNTNSSAAPLPMLLSPSPLDSNNQRFHSSSTTVLGASQVQHSTSAEDMADEDTSSNPSSDSTIRPVVRASPRPASAVFAQANIRKKIIGYLTYHSERTFRPFFKQGMLRGFLAQPRARGDGQPSGYGDVSDLNKREIMADNIEFPELLTSKLFAQDYTQTFYSQNHFQFDDPRAARWFFENVGRRNFTSLNNIDFNIYGGFDFTAYNRNSLTGRSFEELWVEVFNFLKYRHRFRQLVVSVLSMPEAGQLKQDVESGKLTVEDVEDRGVYLARLPSAIENVRGLKKAQLTDWTGEVFPDRASTQRSSLLMQQVRLVYDPAKDMRNLSLSSTLARVRAGAAKANPRTTRAATQQVNDDCEEVGEAEQENKFRSSNSSVFKHHGTLPNRHGMKHQQLKQKHPRPAPRRPTTRVRQIQEEEDYDGDYDDAPITKKMEDTDLDLNLGLDLELETPTSATAATDPAIVTPWRVYPAGSQPGSADWDWMNSSSEQEKKTSMKKKKEKDNDNGDDDDIKTHISGDSGQGGGVVNIGSRNNRFYGRKKRDFGELL